MKLISIIFAGLALQLGEFAHTTAIRLVKGRRTNNVKNELIYLSKAFESLRLIWYYVFMLEGRGFFI
ncbi:hypothetical protein FACS1894113_2980 [Alphaproteobacteria bacterium]|nr:hypothetical protein FACS1894113_2980 [Alphaproteobacteria bacterium]